MASMRSAFDAPAKAASIRAQPSSSDSFGNRICRT